MKQDNRTNQQNKAYWLFQESISQEMNSQSISLATLVTEIKPKPTKTSLHEVFKSICHSMYQKDSTTQLTKEELNNCLEVYLNALATIGVHLEFPSSDRQNLLSYFN
jgi:hypothetical protein